MPLTYDPKDAETAWAGAEYDASLKKVEDKTSSKGNPMQVWTVEVYHPDGRSRLINEYVTAAAAFKLRQLATAIGRKADFDRGTFQADDYIGANFRVDLIVEKQDGFDDQNRIKNFKPAARAPGAPAARQPVSVGAAVRERAAANRPTEPPFTPTDGTFKEDDIPF